jgi:xylitol oxidase
MWLAGVYIAAFPIIGVGLSGLTCTLCCWRFCWPRGQPLPLKDRTYPSAAVALVIVMALWSVVIVLWFVNSPISVCSPLLMRSAPPDREATSMHNWEGFWCTRHCGESAILHPGSVAEVAEQLASATSLRVVGSGHSATDLQCPDPGGLVMSIDGLCAFGGIDAAGSEIHATFSAGCTISKTQQWLMAQGLQLVGYGAIMSQTVAGALATSLHGEFTAFSFGDTLVNATAVLADGTLRTVYGDEVGAWVGSMGELGVVVEVAMRVFPTMRVRCETRHGLQADALAAMADETVDMLVVDSVVGTGERSLAIRTCREVQESVHAGEPIRVDAFPDGTLGLVYETFGLAMLRLLSTVPMVKGSLARGFLLAAPRALHEENAVDASFSSAKGMFNVYPHSEFAVPMERCAAALDLIRAEAERLGLAYIIAIKVVAANKAWRTWAVNRSCSVNLDFYDFGHGDSVQLDLSFRTFAETLAVDMGGGLHLGKMWVRPDRQELLANAPRADEFEALRQSLDPTGKLQNEHTRATHGDGVCSISPLPVELDARSGVWRAFVWLGVGVSLVLAFAACVTCGQAYAASAPEPKLVPQKEGDGLPLLGLWVR